MSWVLLDDNFPTHPKAVQAGPVAAYLFVCGLCYCRKHHTDGFIPEKAVASLGASTNPRRLVDILVRAVLWERNAGGYRVHDYQQMYSDDAEKARQDEKRQKRQDAGRKGGLAKASNARELLDETASKNLAPVPSKPLALRNGEDRIGSSSLILGEESEKGAAPLDRWLEQLQADYPQHRVTYSYMTTNAFHEVFLKDPRPASEVWAEMRANLENQKVGHEWRVKGMTPRLERWLLEGLWKQHHEPDPPAGEQLAPRTNRTLTAAAKIIRGGS